MKKGEAKKWASMLSDVRTDTEDVPDGWRTLAEIARETGRSDSYTRKKVNELVRQGKIESRKFLIKTAVRVYPVPHFRYVKATD